MSKPRKYATTTTPEERAKKIDDAKMALTSGIQALKSGDEWKAMLERMADARKLSIARLSFGNQILLATQGCVGRVATYQTWQRYGRQVRKGEKARVILAPCPFKREDSQGQEVKGVFFKTMSVFGEEQTDVFDESKAVPESVLPRVEDPEGFDLVVGELRALALRLPDVAEIELRERLPGDLPGASGWCETKTGKIVVLTSGATHAEQVSTLAHEIGHAIMHKWGEHHTRSAAEVEAESVAFIVCHALGIDTSRASFPYVATWAGVLEDPVKAVLASGKRIAEAAQKILACFSGEDVADGASALAAE